MLAVFVLCRPRLEASVLAVFALCLPRLEATGLMERDWVKVVFGSLIWFPALLIRDRFRGRYIRALRWLSQVCDPGRGLHGAGCGCVRAAPQGPAVAQRGRRTLLHVHLRLCLVRRRARVRTHL